MFTIRERSANRTRKTGGKDLWNSLEKKVKEVIDRESEDGDYDEVICAGRGESGGEWTEWGWRNEEGSWFHKWGDAYNVGIDLKELGGRNVVMFDILPRDWSLWPIFT